MPKQQKPILYLDIDDTILRWIGARAEAADGAKEFLLWALERYEVRWLSWWFADGVVAQNELEQLSRLLDIPVKVLGKIPACDFMKTGSKIDGIDWDAHKEGRPWIWVEDSYCIGKDEIIALRIAGALDRWYHVNVSEEPDSLRKLFDLFQSEAAAPAL